MGKADAIHVLCDHYGIGPDECAFVGDNWLNDEYAFTAAGVSIGSCDGKGVGEGFK